MTTEAGKLRAARALIEDLDQWIHLGIVGAIQKMPDIQDRRSAIRRLREAAFVTNLSPSSHEGALGIMDRAIQLAEEQEQ